MTGRPAATLPQSVWRLLRSLFLVTYRHELPSDVIRRMGRMLLAHFLATPVDMALAGIWVPKRKNKRGGTGGGGVAQS